jgi:hypothetical protein
MYNSKMIILFLHHHMFRPLFLAIIKQYLYSPFGFSLIPPPLANVYNIGKVLLLFTMQDVSYRFKHIGQKFI